MPRLRLPRRPTDLVMPRWGWIVLAVLTALALLPVAVGAYLWWWVRTLERFGVIWFLPRVAGVLLLIAGLSACAEPPRYICRFVVVEASGEPVVICAPWTPPR